VLLTNNKAPNMANPIFLIALLKLEKQANLGLLCSNHKTRKQKKTLPSSIEFLN
jgi:hypothetical protein